MMRTYLFLCIALIYSCESGSEPQGDIVANKFDSVAVNLEADSLILAGLNNEEDKHYSYEESYDGFCDSSIIAEIDTSNLEGKRTKLLREFNCNYGAAGATSDSLFDLNYDGLKDYVIFYYGQAGTGLKNRMQVYFFNDSTKCYYLNEQLSYLPNPTFYLKSKKITGFYIGNGGGGGARLEWINDQWLETKEFRVDNNNDSTVWVIDFPLKNKTVKIFRQYQYLPPQDILENKYYFED